MYLRKILLMTALTLTSALSHAALTDFELLPSPDAPIKSLATIKIVFPEAKFLGMYGSTLKGVTLTSAEDPSVVYEPCNISYSTFFSSNSETFSLRRKGEETATVVSDPGKYRLHIPAGCIELCGDWYSHLGYNADIDVTYTIGDKEAGYDSYFDPTQLIIRPVPGEVMEFRDVSIKFPVTEQFPTIDIIDPALITLRRDGDGVPQYVIASTHFDGEGTFSFSFRRTDSGYTLPEYLFERGDYTIDIPAGVFRLTGTDTVNDNLSLHYTVTGTNAASEQLREYRLDPAPGNVENIPSITLEYPDLEGDLSFPEGTTDITSFLGGRITLTRLNDDPDLSSVYEIYSATLTEHNKIELLFKNRVSMTSEPRPETISRLGDYRLTVLPNTFKLKDNAFAFNARIEAYYKVTRDVPQNRMERYELRPTDGETVGNIGRCSITFPEATEGLVYPIDASRIILTNTADPEDNYRACGLMLMGNTLSWGWNRPSYPYDDHLTIDREGEYLLRIAAGTMTDYENGTDSNPEITAVIRVFKDSEFLYTLTPAPDRAYTSLETVSVTPDGTASDLRPTGGAGTPASLREASGTEYTLLCDDACRFTLPSPLPEGNYTLKIPAGYFVQTNSRGEEVFNRAIDAAYRIVRPAVFTATVNPPSGSTLSGIPSISVIPTGAALRSFGTNPEAGAPLLSGEGRDMELIPSTSPYSVAFLLPNDITLAPGHYTFTLPAGYITVVDGNGIEGSLGPVTAEYTVRQGSAPQVDGGIFFLNEGVYGSEFGSLDYLESDLTTMHYGSLGEANAGKTPGVTTQYGIIYGNTLYLLAKQTAYGNPAPLLTVADAASLQIESQTELPGNGGRALCPVDSAKVYVGTADGILVYDTASASITGYVEGTQTSSGPYADQTGDMLRLGKYVFAAVQGLGVNVIDPATDRVSRTIALPEVTGVFATSAGRLFAATAAQGTPFVEIDPETLETQPVETEAENISASWDSWRSLPVAADIRGNKIFYVPQNGGDIIAGYDFDSGSYRQRCVTIPSLDGRQMHTYGSAVSTDPASGYIVVTAIGDFGVRDCNAIFFADPANGTIQERMTLRPEHKYWFPAMTFYTPGEGPTLSAPQPLRLTAGNDSVVDLKSLTYLSTGYPGLIVYGAESHNPEVCSVTRTGNGTYLLTAKEKGKATLTLTADYRGVTARRDVEVTVTDLLSTPGIAQDADAHDVFDLCGRLLLKDASPEQIRGLEPGFYIIGGVKTIIR